MRKLLSVVVLGFAVTVLSPEIAGAIKPMPGGGGCDTCYLHCRYVLSSPSGAGYADLTDYSVFSSAYRTTEAEDTEETGGIPVCRKCITKG